jgi:uncharacterized membrane protein
MSSPQLRREALIEAVLATIAGFLTRAAGCSQGLLASQAREQGKN